MNQLTELRKQFQQLENKRPKLKSRLLRNSLKSEQKKIAEKFNNIRK